MSKKYDCIIVGVGGMGSAALYFAAKRGWDVLGIEQFGPAHDRGSSHGQSRIIRRAYFEHPSYVPLCHRAFEDWGTIERESNRQLLLNTGLLQIGWPDRGIVEGVVRSANIHDLELDQLSAQECRRQFPMFRIDDDQVGAFERNAGILLVEKCVQTMIDLALKEGAQTRFDTTVESIESKPDAIHIQTANESFSTERLIICAGAWAPQWQQSLGLTTNIPLEVLRKHQHWFDFPDISNSNSAMPTFLIETESGSSFYGFPEIENSGFKIAEHSGGETINDLSQADRNVCPNDRGRIDDFIKQRIQSSSVHRSHCACFYTMTPDQHFIVDRHHDDERIVFTAGLSGHGFKFAPVIGSYLTRLLDGEREPHIEFLKSDRQIP